MIDFPGYQDFDLKLAQKLLLMTEKARNEYYRSIEDKNWQWWQKPDGDDKVININGEDYEILTRYGYDEFWFGSQFIEGIIRTDIRDIIRDFRSSARSRVPFGFIAKKDLELFIVFRGTMTSPEWINNFNFKPGSKDFLDSKDLGKVHNGFERIYTRFNAGNPSTVDDDLFSIENTISEELKKIKHSQDSKVYVTGHSLGGALATMAAAQVRNLNKFTSHPVLYTFASPRVGDEKFAAYLKSLKFSFRICNTEDIVPTLPLPSVNFVSKDVTDYEEGVFRDPRLQGSPSFLQLRLLLPNLDFFHVGTPIYFTIHKKSVMENHIIPTYKEALKL